jgi:hypothetical protein
LDLGELDRERRPEHAAVAGEVEAVARREDDDVRIEVVDRDGSACR